MSIPWKPEDFPKEVVELAKKMQQGKERKEISQEEMAKVNEESGNK